MNDRISTVAAAEMTCDVLVVGSGGAAMCAAITAKKSGMDVIIAEKQAVYGGTTATSGGMLWIPGNHKSAALQDALDEPDDRETVRRYIIDEAGNFADVDRIDAYLQYGPEMVEFLERETHVEFNAVEYPDYNMLHPDGRRSRSLIAKEYNAGVLGKHFNDLKPELKQLLFLGFAIGSSVEMQQFFRAGRSPKAFLQVAGKMAKHLVDSAIHGGPRRVVRGRALITRLAQTVFELEIPLLLSSPAVELICEDGRVAGAVLDRPEGRTRVMARKGVILGAGGFPHDDKRRKEAYPDNAYDGVNRSVANPANTGDSANMVEAIGGQFSSDIQEAGAWMPTSRVPGIDGPDGVWPHLVDRLKPGFVCVTQKGVRVANESSAYSHFVPKFLEATKDDPIGYVWLIGDKQAVDKWGIGRVRPKPMPRGSYVKSGYLIEADTLESLSSQTGIPLDTLRETLSNFNRNAKNGVDPEFGRGANVYDTYQGDEEHGPNQCLGPVEKPPFYALKMYGGEIGTFAGIKVDKYSRVLDEAGVPIVGVYAVGNDQYNCFGGAYPGAGATLGPGFTFGYVAGRHVSGALD